MASTNNKSGPINSYKGVVDYFQKMCSEHLAVKMFQVGELDEVDVQTNVDPVTRYPLVYLIPQISTIDRGGRLLLGFSLIVADIAKNQGDLQVDAHNRTLMIMQDLLSKITLTDWNQVDMNLEFPVNVVPFVERFNNNLAGWTAEINIEIKAPLDLCAAAFEVGS